MLMVSKVSIEQSKLSLLGFDGFSAKQICPLISKETLLTAHQNLQETLLKVHLFDEELEAIVLKHEGSCDMQTFHDSNLPTTSHAKSQHLCFIESFLQYVPYDIEELRRSKEIYQRSSVKIIGRKIEAEMAACEGMGTQPNFSSSLFNRRKKKVISEVNEARDHGGHRATVGKGSNVRITSPSNDSQLVHGDEGELHPTDELTIMQLKQIGNQRFSARLRRVHSQKTQEANQSANSLTSSAPSSVSNSTHIEFHSADQLPLNNPENSNIATASLSQNFPAGSKVSKKTAEGSKGTTAGLDSITLERTQLSKERMRKVERYLELCEDMFFGKVIHSTSSSSLQLKTSRNAVRPLKTTISTTKQSPKGVGVQMASETIEKEHNTVSSLIRSLILVNNQTPVKSDGKAPSRNLSQNRIHTSSKAADAVPIKWTPLDLLTSSMRKKNVIDNWGPKEVCVFEAAICKYGKDFHTIQHFIPTKRTKDIVDFYYLWKKSSRYVAWKEFRDLSDSISYSSYI